MKPKTKKILIISAIIIAVVIIIVMIYKQNRKPKDALLEQPAGNNNAPGSPGESNKKIDSLEQATKAAGQLYLSLPKGKLPLKEGDRNRLVFKMQTALNTISKSSLTRDGDFGPATRDVLKKNYGVTTVSDTIARKIYKDYQRVIGEFDDKNFENEYQQNLKQ